ncbi:protein kinase domain-containing protein [Planctomyces sp. SH-PL14]|uniref:protein kinase domain-containing protein n=1 Tax=Planctomyces sp. SH-PL14 TaxID=1632864 RepID=UPI00078EF120|nr:protein kinase [Planctomyces sp. SH-PL14]AMV20686.1 Serine/threonine-protein kinase PknB [Planctomyces sp. SH-PL14]
MSDGHPNLETLFLAALELESPEARAAYLEGACGEDPELRGEVEKLLRSHEAAGSFLDRPAGDLAETILEEPGARERDASLHAGLAVPADTAVVLGDVGHSVLISLGRTVELPRVALRESTDGRDPMVRPKSPEMPPGPSGSRYQLQGEIARGGMGAILKGRDTDLGRDLAIKVLLDQHKDKPEVIQRFVEEAQIGGQLQHPGIAPIYELGQFPDRRPFFAMKLVRGETLSKLLAHRASPAVDRTRFLGIFEQVCQTMAYAHSRGVIHRDLKPANIMVGAFGEVQVMDWGLAKVLQAGGVADEKKSQALQEGSSFIQTLRSGAGSGGSDLPGTLGTPGSQTVVGSVMGTPAYMPPEQAHGEVDHLDERADVFGLGAILCEILTGRPPYVGTDGGAVFHQASHGKLADCWGRLDACGADAELIALARHCLELDPKDRPRDAGTLAARVSGYLHSVEVKLRESELAKVDAQVRAEELRRRQKLAFTAGTALALSLVVGLAASLWQAMRADHAAAQAEQAASLAMKQERRALAALDELRATAPAFAEQARALAAREQFREAVEKLDYAVTLRPDAVEYLVAKADLLQCQFRLADAGAVYRQALLLRPDLTRAAESARLCDELLAAKPGLDGTLSHESLAKLHVAMQAEQRPAAEIMPVARLLGEQKRHLVQYWLARLRDLPISAETPLEQRLTVREDGRLALDLSGTKVRDLAPLAGAPLATLKLSRCGELSDLSPLKGMELIELSLFATKVSDLGPLREMRTLESLSLGRTAISDLAGLRGLNLKVLECREAAISDLEPLRGMPLESLMLMGTRVTNLSPLIGMPIRTLDLSWVPANDFSPLSTLPLEKCYLQFVRLHDLEVLRGRPLKELCLWGCTEARHYAVLSEIPTLENVMLPERYRSLPPDDYEAIGTLRGHPRLRKIGGEIIHAMGYEATGSAETFWQAWDQEQALFSALRKKGITFQLDKLPSGRYKLFIANQPLRDLSVLRGMPLHELDLHRCPFSDLTPLRDLKLHKLSLSTDSVTDFSPLRGMSIERLYLRLCPHFQDVAPLTELPLRELYLDESVNVADVAPLAKMTTLEKLSIPVQAGGIDALRDHPRLRLLAFQLNGGEPETTVEEFWKEYRWIRKFREAGIRPVWMRRLSSGRWDVNLERADLTDLHVLEGMPIEVLGLGYTKVTDLSPLRTLPLKGLNLHHTGVSDLGPLRGKGLTLLELFRTPVSDLSPLAGMPLQQLDLSLTKVTDISALRGMPLVSAKFNRCPITDVSPLAESRRLRVLTLPAGVTGFEFLRGFPELERLSFAEDSRSGFRPDKTAEEFWAEYDATR